MADNTERKAKIVKLFKEAESVGDKSTRARRKPAATQSIVGNGNFLAAGDIHYHIENVNRTETIRPAFTPGPEHITAAQARKIQLLVEKLVEIEEKAGGDRKQLFAKWWSMVKNQYNVPSYLAIPAHLGNHAIAWLTQQAAINRPKLRRNDNTSWRNEHYKAIWARSRQLGLSKGEVYALVEERLDKKVASLKQLGEQNLKKLYSIIMSMGRG